MHRPRPQHQHMAGTHPRRPGRAETTTRHPSRTPPPRPGRPPHTATAPDAVWMRCDRFVAVDHHQDRTYLVCTDPGPNTNTWLEHTRAALAELKPLPDPPAAAAPLDLAPHLERPHQDYIVDIKRSLNHLAQCHSYANSLTHRHRRRHR